MPSVQLGNTAAAVALESIGTGSAGRPHVLMGWVRATTGEGTYNSFLLGSFRTSGSRTGVEGNMGFVPSLLLQGSSNLGRGGFTLGITFWDFRTTPIDYPNSTTWYYIVLQFGSGSNSITNMKVFNDSSLTKFTEIVYNGYPTVDNIVRYMGISGGSANAQFRDVRAFYSGAFTDAECIAQARSTTPVAHNTAVLWDAWPFDTLQFTGSINNKVLKITGTPTLAPDQPFVFINPTTLVTGSNSSQVQISTTGYSPVIIGAR